MSLTNQLKPKPLPGRWWGFDLYRQVHYRQGELGALGFLARWVRQGRIPLELRQQLAPARMLFDHAEFWLGYEVAPSEVPVARPSVSEYIRNLDRRILVGHPYRADQPALEALAAACDRFNLSWSLTTPESEGRCPHVTHSWYSRDTFLVVVVPRGVLVTPGPEVQIPHARSERRPLEPGETVVERNAQPPKKRTRRGPAPVTLRDALTNPGAAIRRTRAWEARQAREGREAEEMGREPRTALDERRVRVERMEEERLIKLERVLEAELKALDARIEAANAVVNRSTPPTSEPS